MRMPRTAPSGPGIDVQPVDQAAGRALDALIAAQVPGVRKAVKWNSPFYGAPEAEGWFLSFHCFAKYIKVTFFQGGSLDPPPPETSRYPAVRYAHLREGEVPGEKFAAWIRQASRLPGETL